MNVLFLSEANAARSIMAEALLARLGGETYQAFSAGRNPGRTPGSKVSAHALETLKLAGFNTVNLRSKSWNEFVTPTAPTIDIVVTLDHALEGGPFPIWHNKPVFAHWPFDNPQKLSQNDQERQGMHRRLFSSLEHQILKLTSLKLDGLGSYAMTTKLNAISPKG